MNTIDLLKSVEKENTMADKFTLARAKFPGALAQTYIDVASRGLMPGDAPQVAYDHLQDRVLGRADKAAYFAVVEQARSGIARLMNAHTDEIAMTKNVSDGLNMVAAAIDWQAGEEVWICSAVEHPNNLYPWRNLEALGVSVRDFPAAGSEFPVDAVVEALQGAHRARVVTVSATSFLPGFRVDLDRLGHACRASGVRLVVDGAQSIGISHIDVEKTPIDALAMSTQKGLCSVYGMGFLYVRSEFASQLSPRYLARFGVDIPATHEADYDAAPIQLQPAALRFDLGNYNFLAATLVTRTLDLLNGLGSQDIDKHVCHLAKRFSDGLIELGVPLKLPKVGMQANMVCIESQRGQSPALALQAHLKTQNVQAAVRRNAVRFSFHFYNNEEDVAAALAGCGSWLTQHRPAFGFEDITP
ncbi:hypothetical protein D9X30_4601 (plasmid) [Cupriavidus sp. U2]|uniref:aminotransferase class V-fold PLP-dependent enzyme n=1 Tax=Cupriavidus sp. U2 TaxID=2920269 RepID=UPI00129D38B7|nr:aminotransferase class V-fold PLP-dependent enzyme [Cupriavidus sp. U2]KAI3590368.1 hypothetical protein D9X30_4601 [Cupriavidus sp. U2]